MTFSSTDQKLATLRLWRLLPEDVAIDELACVFSVCQSRSETESEAQSTTHTARREVSAWPS